MLSLQNNPKFIEACKLLYNTTDTQYQAKRYENLYDLHTKKYGNGGKFFSSPGRIELLGNHTDHNNGKVLCASISVDTLACVTPYDGKIIIDSIGYPPVEIDLNDLEIHKEDFGKSEGMVRGTVAYFKQNGYKIGGFAATTTSDVFKGAGVSSSAAFEVLVAEILNQLFNDGKLDAITKAKAAHLAESEYYGKPCGLLDQSAIAIGGVSYIDFKSTTNPKVEQIKWGLDDVAIAITNTGGDHANLTDQYAAIREEMEAVAKCLGAKKLRKVKEEKFYDSIKELREKVSDRAIERAIHYYNENKRVDVAAKALKKNNAKKYFAMVNESGQSSQLLLQNAYANGSTSQPIVLGVTLAKRVDGVLASRLMGGGFAGCTLSFIKKDALKDFDEQMYKVFGKENVYNISVRNVGTCKVDL